MKTEILKQNENSWNALAEDFFGVTALPVLVCSIPTEDELHFFPDLNGKAVFEMGCGSGHSLKWCAEHGAKELFGLDISEEQLKAANKLLGENGYSCTLFHQPKDVSQSINWIEIVNCIFSFVTLIGGAWCFVLVRRLKEKQMDATFSFLTRLGFRIKLIYNALENYHLEILDTLCIPTSRNSSSDDNNSYTEKIVENFLINTKETLKLVLNSDDQVPVKEGWTQCYNLFVEFLDIYTRTEDNNYYLWANDCNTQKDAFYKKHKENMKQMLDDIQAKQKELEKKLSKKL